MYASAIGGHVWIQNTYRGLKRLFYWDEMKQQVKGFVESYDVCMCIK